MKECSQDVNRTVFQLSQHKSFSRVGGGLVSPHKGEFGASLAIGGDKPRRYAGENRYNKGTYDAASHT